MSARIKEARLARGWSQQDLADRVRVSQPTIVHWEQGTHAPRHLALARLADALGVSRQWLLGDDVATEAAPPPARLASTADPRLPSYLAAPLHHVAIHAWPADARTPDRLRAGLGQPIDWLPVRGPLIDPVGFTCGDDAVRSTFAPGAIVVFDRGRRDLEDDAWFLVAADAASDAPGAAARLRRYRASPRRMEADTLADTLFLDHEPLVLGRLVACHRTW